MAQKNAKFAFRMETSTKMCADKGSSFLDSWIFDHRLSKNTPELTMYTLKT